MPFTSPIHSADHTIHESIKAKIPDDFAALDIKKLDLEYKRQLGNPIVVEETGVNSANILLEENELAKEQDSYMQNLLKDCEGSIEILAAACSYLSKEEKIRFSGTHLISDKNEGRSLQITLRRNRGQEDSDGADSSDEDELMPKPSNVKFSHDLGGFNQNTHFERLLKDASKSWISEEHFKILPPKDKLE